MAKRKMNENSLKNLKDFSRAERVENGRKGAAITNAKIAERKTLAEIMKVALRLANQETGEINEIAITNALINKAAKGDVSAYLAIRDTIGEKPSDKQIIEGNVGVKKVFITPQEQKN
ncbi:MAG: hypothetical protein J6Q32_00040, partial [Clostridia bacterium]|nr:hypothetical protein [Clostridia bacterium]